MKNQLIKTIIFTIFVFGALTNVKINSVSAAQEQTKKSQPVKIKKAESNALGETIKTTGEINVSNKITIKPMLDGYINYLPYKEGDVIPKGAKIAEINRDIYNNEIAVAQAALSTAEAVLADLLAPARIEEISIIEEKIKKLKSNLEFTEKDLKRIKQMVEKNYLPGEDLEKAEITYTNLKTDLKTAEEQLNILKNGAPKTKIEIQKSIVNEKKANLEMTKSKIAEAVITAPFNATVTKLFLQFGDLCKSGSPILEIYDNASIIVKFSIAEIHLSQISKKSKVNVLIDAFPDKNFSAEISKIYPEIDRQTRNVFIEAKLLNAPSNIFPGMFARVELPLKQTQGILVPSQSIITNAKGEKGVFIVKDNKALFQKITVLIENKNRSIVKGITAGDAVVVEGQETLKNNDEIKIIGGEKK